MRSFVRALIVLGMAVLGSGCGDEEMDCRDICQTVQSCVVANVDVSECADICEAFAETNQAMRDRVEACNECLDSFGCSGGSVCQDVCDFLIVPIEGP